MPIRTITHYFDYKSPYAYLAQEETFQLEKEYSVSVDFLPLTLDIPQFLGAAEVDAPSLEICENSRLSLARYIVCTNARCI